MGIRKFFLGIKKFFEEWRELDRARLRIEECGRRILECHPEAWTSEKAECKANVDSSLAAAELEVALNVVYDFAVEMHLSGMPIPEERFSEIHALAKDYSFQDLLSYYELTTDLRLKKSAE